VLFEEPISDYNKPKFFYLDATMSWRRSLLATMTLSSTDDTVARDTVQLLTDRLNMNYQKQQPHKSDTTTADATSFLVENHNMSSKGAAKLSMSTAINCTRPDSINHTFLAKVRRGRTNSTGGCEDTEDVSRTQHLEVSMMRTKKLRNSENEKDIGTQFFLRMKTRH